MRSTFSGIQKLVSRQSPEPDTPLPEQSSRTKQPSPTDEERVPSPQNSEATEPNNQLVPYSVILLESENQEIESLPIPKSPMAVDGDCDSSANPQRSQPIELCNPIPDLLIEEISDGSESVQVTGTTGLSVSSRMYGSFTSRKLHAEVNTTFGEIDEVRELINAVGLLRTVSESKPFDPQVVYEFWANLPTVEPETDSTEVLVQNWVYEFTPDRINALFGLASVDERTEQRHMAEVITLDIALFVSGGKAKVFKQFQLSKVEDNNTKDLLKICCTNWLPTTNDGYVTPDRAKLVYKVMHQEPFDFGRMVFKLIINLGLTPVSKLCLPFPSLIYQLIQSQHPVHPDVSQPVPKSNKKGKAKRGQTAEVPV
ncbi:uncharacterized protein LOC111830620 [Capsella rubella]|uniref:uncharacterized protein LOC111830620 n=1 Tax=Capsella rubella TaxID=81985 RepID=UPI000CD5BB65|nr:uncharacterized protein LOC111830620 [Capsella rubella]